MVDMLCKSNNVVTFADAARDSRGYDFIGVKKLITTLAIVLCCTLGGGVALALDPHTAGIKGQPTQSCETSMVTPGKTANLPAHSVFNEDSTASAHYANPTTQGGMSSGNPHVVSQYDVACFQQAARMTQQSAKISVGHGHGR